MSSQLVILLVAVLSGASGAVIGVYLVLRKMAMIADAISHAILPGIVAGYVLAQGPDLLAGIAGAVASGLVTVGLVEGLTRSRAVKEDSAIGLVFPAMFAIGVLVISKYFSNIHLDTDAVLYGEIAMAPFDTFEFNGRNYGPQSLWILGGSLILNALFVLLFAKELKHTTFDSEHAATLGAKPALIQFGLMVMVALTTVAAFSAVGAILSVALIIVPATCAVLLSRKLSVILALATIIGIGGGAAGFGLATLADVSISGMIATVLGGLFVTALVFSPERGAVAAMIRRRRQRLQFAIEALVVHLSAHEGTESYESESQVGHLERELGWDRDFARRVVETCASKHLIVRTGDNLQLTVGGRSLALRISALS